MRPLVLILLAGALGVAGQVILKRAMTGLGSLSLQPEALPDLALGLAFNPMIVLGLVVYLSGTFFWLIALSRADLSYAYPVASLNYVLILLSSWWLLGEQPSAPRIAGVIIICFGVWAITRTPMRTSGRARTPKPAPVGAITGGPEL